MDRDFLERIDRHMARTNEHMARTNEHIERSNEHMARGNEHMARGNEHMARGNEHMERGNVLMDQLMQTSQRQIQATEDLRFALNQMNMRQERITAQLSETIAENTRTLREGRKEFVEEMRAQRAALFRILDRLDGGGSAATA